MDLVPLSSLMNDPSNARKHSPKNLASIKGSLAKFGQQKPIVVSKDNIVLAGNGTLEAAKSLGWDTIGIIRSSLTGAEAVAYAIADNRTGELAEWDDDILRKTLTALKEENFDLDAIGFSDEDLEKWITDTEVFEPGCDEDEVPEQVDTRCKLGDMWILGEHRLLCGDSTDVLQVERLMVGEKSDLCFSSPPYNLGSTIRGGKSVKRIYNKYDDKKSDESYENLLNGFLSVSLMVAEIAIINIQMLSANRIAMISWLNNFKSNFVDCLIWSKTNPQPAASEKVVNRGFEFLFIFDKNENPNTAIRTANFKRGEFTNVYSSSVATRKLENGDHKAIFSVEFATHYLSNFSVPNSRIYEPFCGSGTTIIACEKTGRKCYGMEIDPHYCDVILARWEKYTGKEALLSGG